MAFAVVFISVLILQFAGGKDLYWQPNSNWDNPSNWALGRTPGCRDQVSLTSVAANSIVYLNTNTTVESISLPANGHLVLGPSVTIRLSSEADCIVPGPMVASVENEFIGANTELWECTKNWLTEDLSPVDHPPCGEDRAFFKEGFFSTVSSNESIFVRSLSVRGTMIQSQADLDISEFNLRIEINSNCSDDPSFCPCPDDKMCPKTTESPSVNVNQQKGSNTGGTVAGILVSFIFVAVAVIVLVVLGIFLYRRRKSIGYIKDELMDEPEPSLFPSVSDSRYDNPIFSDEKIGMEYDGKHPMPMASEEREEEIVPVQDEGKPPKLNEYQLF